MYELFDEAFYRAKYEAAADIDDAYEYYLQEGWKLGHMPNAFLDPEHYAAINGIDAVEPLAHLLENWRSIKGISPAFDARRYLELYPDVKQAGLAPFEHFIRYGLEEGRVPGLFFYDYPDIVSDNPEFDWQSVSAALGFDVEAIDQRAVQRYLALFDPQHYQKKYNLKLGTVSPIDHYSAEGFRYQLKPNPLFDPQWYANAHALENVNPVIHHVMSGSRPAPYFCEKSYLRSHPEIQSSEDAFAHFVSSGRKLTTDIGVNKDILAILKKLHASFDWSEAEAAFEGLRTPGRSPDKSSVDFTGKGKWKSRKLDPPSPVDDIQLASILSKAIGKSVVSFDIWDTVLRRNCDPDEIKLFAATVLARELRQLDSAVQLSSAEIFKLRQFAEYRVADRDYEYTHEAMLLEWLNLAGVPQAEIGRVAKTVFDAEVNKEIHETRLDKTIERVIRELDAPKLIAVSDFYLPEGVLRRLLDHHGILNAFSDVFVSSDHMKTKRAGGLFQHVMDDLGVSADEIIHIGDNVDADVKMPLSLGIDAIHFIDPNEERRKKIQRQLFNGMLTNDRAALAELLHQRLVDPDQVDAEGHTSSSSTLACIVGCFAAFTLDLATRMKVDEVFFATREGIFFKDVYDLLATEDVLGKGAYPESVLLEVSRRATFAASLRRVSTDELMRIWSLYSTQSMTALARSLNLSPGAMKRQCKRFDIEADDPIQYPWQDERVIAMFDDPKFRDWLSAECIMQRNELLAYLENSGFAPSRSQQRLFVDIGWRGSIQDNLAFVSNGQINGAYMAIYPYLSEQPLNASKHGFMMDLNKKPAEHLGEFAALEFIFNGPGGSVIGYKNGQARKEKFADEESLMADAIVPYQSRLLLLIRKFASQLAFLPMDPGQLGEAVRIAAKSYVDYPDQEIADIFQKLDHNETFGTGEVDSMSPRDLDRIGELSGSEIHDLVMTRFNETRWPQAWVRSSGFEPFTSDTSLDKKLMLPRVEGIARSPAYVRSLGQTVSIIAPTPIAGSGGHRTIYNLARALDRAGFNVSLFSETRGEDYEYKEKELAGTSVQMFDHWFSGVVPNVAIATILHSARYLSKYFSDDVNKMYFIQDFEAQFNPVSDQYIRGENSFTEGHTPICIGRWLTHVLATQFGTPAATAGLGVDTGIYKRLDDVDKLDCIAVLYQPEKTRRLPEHCLQALEIVKRRRPQTEIIFFGSNARPDVHFEHTHYGLMHNLEEINHLYNVAKLGLCVSLTNPSRIPFEMMAAGCVPVDVYRYNNLFDYRDGTGVLAFQSAESIAGAMLNLLSREGDRAKREAKCIADGSRRTLRWENDAAVNAVEYIIEGNTLNELPMPQPYFHDSPFIAEADQTQSVQAWCDWQYRLATAGLSPQTAPVNVAKESQQRSMTVVK